MNKTAKYAINGAIFIGIGNAIINAIKQLSEMDKNPQQKFDWGQFFIAGGKGAVMGGIGGAVIGAIADHENSLKTPVNTDVALYALVKDVKLDKSDREYLTLNGKAERLMQILNSQYSDKLKSSPIKRGSTENGTALKSKFDIDISLQFRHDSFKSTEEMYDSVSLFLKQIAGKHSITNIRDQKKSFGVFFDLDGKQAKIDIVPCKISKGRKSSGYLFKNERSFLEDASSYTKTDIHALKKIKLTKTQESIVVILKNWKLKNEIPLSSHLLVNLVLDAYKYNYGQIPTGLTNKTIMVLAHIRDNLNVAVIRSIENTNNILTDISTDNKNKIIAACKSAIEEYKYQPNSIVEALA